MDMEMTDTQDTMTHDGHNHQEQSPPSHSHTGGEESSDAHEGMAHDHAAMEETSDAHTGMAHDHAAMEETTDAHEGMAHDHAAMEESSDAHEGMAHDHSAMEETTDAHEGTAHDHESMKETTDDHAGMAHDHSAMSQSNETGEGMIHMHHHDMGGEVMSSISPASPLWMGIILIGAALITLVLIHRKKGASKRKGDYLRLNLLSFKPLKKLVTARPFQFILQLPVVILFLLIIVFGLFGVQAPGKNFATVATWTIWWSCIIFIILFLGASWCLVCPWAALADWIERLSFWKKTKGTTLGRKWPRSLKSRHPMTLFFIVVTWLELGIFITYNPRMTALFSIAIFLLTLATIMVFTKKSFCRYLCFVGGIIGIYSNLSPIEIRSKDKAVCNGCKTKDCVTGNEKGYPCPIYEYPGGMDKNTNCILCTECIKTCPSDNMTVNGRPFFADISRGDYRGRYDEALLALTILGLTIYHGFTMLPLWFGWAIETMKSNYPLYIVTFTLFLIGFVAVPVALHYLTAFFMKVFSGRKDLPLKSIFIHYSYALLPVALFYHIAHNLSHLNTEGLKILPVLSDPFGWGWNLFGTRDWTFSSVIGGGSITDIQFSVILLGLVTSIIISYKISGRLFGREKGLIRAMIPMIIIILGYSYLSLITLLMPMVLRTVSYF